MNQQSTGSNDFLFEVRDGIGRATFNRPQARNAFTFEMCGYFTLGRTI